MHTPWYKGPFLFSHLKDNYSVTNFNKYKKIPFIVVYSLLLNNSLISNSSTTLQQAVHHQTVHSRTVPSHRVLPQSVLQQFFLNSPWNSLGVELVEIRTSGLRHVFFIYGSSFFRHFRHFIELSRCTSSVALTSLAYHFLFKQC